MIKEMFLGKNPSDFHVNAAVKVFILSESFLWPAWNLMAPILAIFAANRLPEGGIETVGFGYSIHLISRVIFELISGRFLSGSHSRKKVFVIICGISLLSITYVGFAFTNTISQFFLSMGLAGVGFGILSPAKNALFSTHLDKDKESVEWGMTDATVFIAIALAASLGGLIASRYGFPVLFLLAACVNILAALPYILYLNYKQTGTFHFWQKALKTKQSYH